MNEINHYPLLVNLKDKCCVIVGGGHVAERKAGSLIEAGASVTVISPVCSSQIEQWMQQGALSILRGFYSKGMRQIDQSLLVFAATDNPEINEAVRLEAESLGKLVTVADNTSGSSFIVPAVVRRGKLLISVSTGGASPTIARKIKQELEQTYGFEYEAYLDIVQELRLFIQSEVNDTTVRQQMFRMMLDWELMSLIRTSGKDTSWKQELIDLMAAEPTMDGMKQIGLWIQQYIK
ncbi:bifunctional precorrin-2 dehydrogenase/sirohydrochlorin ferrochelatase [Paenibacillus sp. 1_12]|uniref:precorrin-2 dehydrogenase/sirohydrochlorin ferrochelatase family protein n=1 Tax=Paenibacillus sp. 1_12 TaxID=1566278 RepID=UPI001160BCD2|nr:bifunctional precorrin-2 dehydrogenase/sirohydrochlorin ferrochelatase [Paenibacillus sp. 1_12]